jgi:hypothetical protein
VDRKARRACSTSPSTCRAPTASSGADASLTGHAGSPLPAPALSPARFHRASLLEFPHVRSRFPAGEPVKFLAANLLLNGPDAATGPAARRARKVARRRRLGRSAEEAGFDAVGIGERPGRHPAVPVAATARSTAPGAAPRLIRRIHIDLGRVFRDLSLSRAASIDLATLPARAHHCAAHPGRLPADHRPHRGAGPGDGGAGNSNALVGTPETVAQALLDYVDLGVDIISMRSYDLLGDAIDVGRHVIPLVREEVAKRDAGAAGWSG